MEYAHIDSCNLHVWLKLHSWFTGVAAMPPRKKQKARTKQKDKARGVAAMPPRKKQKARTKQKDKARAKPLDPLMKRPASKRPASPELDDGNVPLMKLKMKRPASNPRSGTLKPDDGSLAFLGDELQFVTILALVDLALPAEGRLHPRRGQQGRRRKWW